MTAHWIGIRIIEHTDCCRQRNVIVIRYRVGRRLVITCPHCNAVWNITAETAHARSFT